MKWQKGKPKKDGCYFVDPPFRMNFGWALLDRIGTYCQTDEHFNSIDGSTSRHWRRLRYWQGPIEVPDPPAKER